jgi:hypothetical protein
MTPDTTSDYRKADTHTTVEFSKATHDRLTAAQRESESVAATIDRALDALEREQAMPAAVRDRLHGVVVPGSDAAGRTNFRIWNTTHARLKGHTDGGDTLDDTISRALDALARGEHLPDVVAEVCGD